MIRTRYGSEVEIIKVDGPHITIKRKADGKEFMVYLTDLNADKGMEEISAAIKAVTLTDLTEIRIESA